VYNGAGCGAYADYVIGHNAMITIQTKKHKVLFAIVQQDLSVDKSDNIQALSHRVIGSVSATISDFDFSDVLHNDLRYTTTV
jgi:hypothetical protein